MNLIKLTDTIWINPDHIECITNVNGQTSICMVGSEEGIACPNKSIESIVAALEQRTFVAKNPIPMWIEALAERNDATNAEVLKNALIQIKVINDARPHDSSGYEINDIIEAAFAHDDLHKQTEEMK